MTSPKPPPPIASPPPRPTERPRTSVTCVGSRRAFGLKVTGGTPRAGRLRRVIADWPVEAQPVGDATVSQPPCDLRPGRSAPRSLPDMTVLGRYLRHDEDLNGPSRE